MSGRYLLDTNVAVAVLNGEPEALARVQPAPPRPSCPRSFWGEHYFGAMKSGRRDADASRASQFVTTTILLGVAAENGAAIRRHERRAPESGYPLL
jgi:predicted nucleic acid-binding protein